MALHVLARTHPLNLCRVNVRGLRRGLYRERAGVQVSLGLTRWGSSTVHLIGTKTESERDVPMHPELAEMIERRIADGLCDAERLFPRSRRSSFANQVCESMREAALQAGLTYGREEKGGFTAHSFRHTFISRLAERSLPRETITKLSGHTSSQGIEPYLHATPESISGSSGNRSNGIRRS